jgi:hypothetical protein
VCRADEAEIYQASFGMRPRTHVGPSLLFVGRAGFCDVQPNTIARCEIDGRNLKNPRLRSSFRRREIDRQ